MDHEMRQWIHTTNQNVLVRNEGRLDWIRKRTVEVPRVYYDNEKDGSAEGFVELLVNLFVENPSSPPIIGIACEVSDDGGPEIPYTIWYYGANEFFGADFAGEVPKPASKLAIDEECVDPPEWVWPEEESDE